MRYHITHTTLYRYGEPVTLCQNQAHLTPRSFARQHCEELSVSISPTPTAQQTWTDYFGNEVTFLSFDEPHKELLVAAASTVEVFEPIPPFPGESPPWEAVRDALIAGEGEVKSLTAAQFLYDSPFITRSSEALAYARPFFTPRRPLLEAALELTAHIFADFKYDPQATNVNTPTTEVFKRRRGVCQDFAHLQITCLRSLGLAARYVSGYLMTAPAAGQPRLVGADASHAWVSVYAPGQGWFDFDPTNNQTPGLRHVTLAWGRDYGDVCPIKGVFLGGGTHQMRVSVDVSPVPVTA